MPNIFWKEQWPWKLFVKERCARCGDTMFLTASGWCKVCEMKEYRDIEYAIGRAVIALGNMDGTLGCEYLQNGIIDLTCAYNKVRFRQSRGRNCDEIITALDSLAKKYGVEDVSRILPNGIYRVTVELVQPQHIELYARTVEDALKKGREAAEHKFGNAARVVSAGRVQ